MASLNSDDTAHAAARAIVIGSPTPHHVQHPVGNMQHQARPHRKLTVSYVPGAGGATGRDPRALEGLISVTASPSIFENGSSKQNGRFVSDGRERKLLRARKVPPKELVAVSYTHLTLPTKA